MARIFELTTPLGQDLLFRSLHGREELGRLSEFNISAVSTRPDIAPGDLLGKSVTVKVELRSAGAYRYLNGYVTRFAQGGMVGRYYEYRMTVGSWLWFLTRTADCRIFQEKTVPEIVKEVFADHSVAMFEDGLTGTYGRREYCVQYRETDFDFVSRLMEEEGIYHYLDHQDGRHVLKLVDSYSGHKALENAASIAYYPPHQESHSDEEFIHALTCIQGIQPGVVALDDYDFTKPKADLAVKAQLLEKHERADYEIFDWPGEYSETGNGEHYVRARVDEFHAEFERAEAECNVREIAVGGLFNLTNAPRRDQDREYLIVGAWYDLRDNAYETAPEETSTYNCTLTILQSRQQFRPARITARPAVKGLHSAVVVGPGGEEIWCDKYGRVKVQFHWDRYGKKDENSSCWIRVAHQWAGATWGVIALPRIGQEVIIDFLEGDPDQPIIVGRVYNADQMPPYALPANATQSGIKSRSSKGGGPANFNEIRLEDLKGSEQLFIHAEKNQDIEVENDETHWVGHDRTKTIDNDETTHVKHDRTEMVGNNEVITIDGNRTERVKKDESITISGNRAEGVGENESVSIDGNRTVTVGGVESISVAKNQSVNVKGDQGLTIDQKQTVSVGDSLSVNVTNDSSSSVGKNRQATIGENDSLKAGKNLVLAAGDQITIQTGSASITLKKDGTITIKGKDITLDGSGRINIKASSEVVVKGSKITQN